MSHEVSQDFKIHLHEMSIDYNRDAFGLITIKQKTENRNHSRTNRRKGVTFLQDI